MDYRNVTELVKRTSQKAHMWNDSENICDLGNSSKASEELLGSRIKKIEETVPRCFSCRQASFSYYWTLHIYILEVLEFSSSYGE